MVKENPSCVDCGVPAQEVGGSKCMECPTHLELLKKETAQVVRKQTDGDPLDAEVRAADLANRDNTQPEL